MKNKNNTPPPKKTELARTPNPKYEKSGTLLKVSGWCYQFESNSDTGHPSIDSKPMRLIYKKTNSSKQ